MKKFLTVIIFLFCVLIKLYSQTNSSSFSPQNLPLELYLQIGFLFVYIVLGLLFLLLFLFYPQQRLHLFFSLYNICLAILVLNILFFNKNSGSQTAENLISRLIGSNILLFIVYALNKAKPVFWWFNAFFIFIDFPLLTILQEKYTFISEIFHCGFTLVCFVLAIVAFNNKKSTNWLIGLIALAVTFINLQSHLLFFAAIQIGSSGVAGITPFVITISAVIYLAVRYGRANIFLEQQLQQVQILSDKNIQSEKEKQQILSSQNETLEKQVTERTAALNKSLNDLKSAQAQLIQAEKMASLGELTAGIAHEIQNPLNFVNNFSEVNKELIEEVEDERLKKNGERDEALETELLNDIKQNTEKIIHHGKRADSIVKGMLQHSRVNTGKKELTDINALCDEYLRLSYHGLRAKDKEFNATINTDFDDSIGKVNIIPQDISRVLLNLFNNAFYAVNEKKSTLNGTYEPTVSVCTKKLNDKVEIAIKDNGNGIPKNVIDKIFQPFFTTKPTGEGTGLGLSLSYDIIKAHGGEIKAKSKEGNGAEFIIQLPLSAS